MRALKERLIRIGRLRRAVRRAKVFSKIFRYRVHRLLNHFDPMRRTACTRDTLRCRDDIHSANYCFHCLGQDTPVCCIAKVAEILFWLADAFDKHDIPYFVLWGTHLGAIRHRGFIPWDLDADIGIEAASEERVRQLIGKKAAERGYHLTKDDDYILRVAYSRTNFQHVDIELWREHERFQDSLYTHTLYGEVIIPRADMFPLREYPFYDRTLRGPRKDDYLKKALGDNIYTHGYRRYDLTSDEEFVLKDPPPASIRISKGR